MVLACENVRRVYGETVALDGVSLSVEEGEVFALIGPNGAGKTTLIRSLTGTTEYEGHVELFGTPPERTDPQEIGLLPQSFSPAGRLTARELIAYYAGLYEQPRTVEEVLADVGMAANGDTWYENLSGGQQRRVCVGTALAGDPELLVLDEPTTGIDPSGRQDLWGLLDRLTAQGTTVILTTHYMDEAEYLADRVGLLADGSLVAEGSPAELIAEHGGDSQLSIDVDDTEAAAQVLESTGTDSASVEPKNGTVTIHGADPQSIGGLLAALDQEGIGYDALIWRQPDLESVYLALTESESDSLQTTSTDQIETDTASQAEVIQR